MTTAAATSTPAPVQARDRIWNLDMLRGLAILGILVVNALCFAWPLEVLMSSAPPPGSESQADLRGFWAIDVFFHEKFRSLFSMLFGVSVFLVGGERHDPARGPVLVRRLLWLGVFGLIHGLAFWYGDILLHYAYCGLIMMLMRSWSGKRLLWVGGSITAALGVLTFLMTWAMGMMPPEMAEQARQGQPASDPATIQAAIELYRSGLAGALGQNFKGWLMLQLMVSPMLIFVTVPLMILGLGLFKTGYLTGEAKMSTYALVLVAGGANLALLAWFGWEHLAGGAPYPLGGFGPAMAAFAPLISLFYVTVLVLVAKTGLKILTAPLVPVGRMAFTNYLTQTLIMVTLYYMPWGPRLMGEHGPVMMWAVVVAVWIAQLIWSPIWLRYFRMGPFEWLWRRLTYKGDLPLRREAAPAVA